MKIIKILFLLIYLFSVTACNKEEQLPEITSLTLNLSKTTILGDGVDSSSVTVVNQAGLDVKRFVTIYNGNQVCSQKRVQSTIPSISKVYASFNNIRSNEVEVEIIEDKNLKFEKNVLIEQYTGTWCGYCPRAIYQIETLQKTDKKVVHAALHLSDEMTNSLNVSLFQSFGFTGVPTLHADRTVKWEGSTGVISAFHNPARAGIYLNVTGDASSIKARIKIKFGLKFSESLKLTVYLVHDSLIANQKNFYDTDANSPYYQKGSVMINFIHRNVMLQNGTNIFGDNIPGDSIGIARTYTREISFSNFRCENIKNLKVIAIVTYGSGIKMETVLNCIIGRVGETKDYVFAN
jgi:thiol-disulfide isomerase/thioredoxin